MLEFAIATGFGFCIGVSIPFLLKFYENSIQYHVNLNCPNDSTTDEIYKLCRLKNEIDSKNEKKIARCLTM